MIARLRRALRKDKTPFLVPPIQLVGRGSIEVVPVVRGPLTCRVCTNRAQVQLCGPDGNYEMLCYDDLGPFLETWTDPNIREFTVVKL